jgi:bcr-type benzoyl-CoA reductase subunit B
MSRVRWKSDVLTAPLHISARTKELVGLHYLKGRYANQRGKVAWVTSGAPVELLKALDFYVLYPENHGAICGTIRVAEEIMSEAENAGFSRDICSYARTDIGSVISGRTPVGKLPMPDLLVACTNICQTVLHWYRVLAHHFNVPLLLIDTPFVYAEVEEHAVSFVRRQLEEAIPLAERISGKTLDARKLEETVRMSRRASELWLEVLQRCQNRPSPISVFDQFTQMAPIVEMRGDPETVDFYAAMLKEVDERISNGVGVLADEKKRLLWDNLPIWYRMRYLGEFLGKSGVAIVASTYTNAWGELAELFDPDQPFESMARTYIFPILNRGTGAKLETMRRMIADYQLDGVILHSDRSCKPYSVGQMDQRDRLVGEDGVPALLVEADHSDPRVFAEEQVANRLQTFVEILEV